MCLCLSLPVYPGVGVVMAVAWPLALVGGDLVVTGHHLPTQEAMANKGLLTQQSGNGIVAAVFAAGLLLQVLNGTKSGHLPDSARVMLLSVLGILAGLVPTASDDPKSDLSWTVYAAQRVVLHSAIGLFILATALAWRTDSIG